MHYWKILLVEAHSTNASELSCILRESGHHVNTVETCAAAIELIREHSFDVVLSDLVLPDGNGCDLLPSLLKIRSLRAMAILAYDMEEDKARRKSADSVTYIPKPVDTAKLCKLLDDLALTGGQFPFAPATDKTLRRKKIAGLIAG